MKSRTWLSDFTFTFHFHALEKEMATHSSVLAWRILRTGQPGGLSSMGSHRVRHDWSDLAAAAAAVPCLWACVLLKKKVGMRRKKRVKWMAEKRFILSASSWWSWVQASEPRYHAYLGGSWYVTDGGDRSVAPKGSALLQQGVVPETWTNWFKFFEKGP